MEIGDLVQWAWYSGGSGSMHDPEVYKVYRGIVISDHMDREVQVLVVVDNFGMTEVRADEVEVISETR
jgi:hypothetical protein